MSFEAIAWAWVQNEELTAVTKMVLLSLANHHNLDSKRCDPSINRIARYCCCSRSSVIRALDTLEKAGYIEKVHRKSTMGDSTSNQYWLPRFDQGGSATQTLPSIPQTPHSVPVTPKPVIEPVIEEKKEETPYPLTPPSVLEETVNPSKKKTVTSWVEPPEWLDASIWQQFLTHRREMKRPVTNTAARLLLRKLEKEREAGQDPNQMVTHAIEHGWQGIYPLKEQKNGTAGNQQALDAFYRSRNVGG